MSLGNETPGRPADLFEELRVKTGATYLSDMRFTHRESAIRAAAQEQAEPYSLHEWNDALDYLLSHQACSSAEEAKQIFVQAVRLLES